MCNVASCWLCLNILEHFISTQNRNKENHYLSFKMREIPEKLIFCITKLIRKYVWIMVLKHGVMSGISLFFFRADLSPQRLGIGWMAHLQK